MRRLFTLLFAFNTLILLANVPKVPSTYEIGDLKIKIESSAQKIIQKHVDDLCQSSHYHEEMTQRAQLYFPIIEKILEEYGVPDKIKYLCIQESGLVSDAVSSSKAVGYWQFKDFTAIEMGLRVDKKIDERKNIVSSSQAAAKYLSQHNFFFKNWIYSIMAYNTGRGGAQKYLDEKNFGAQWMPIDKKTHWYVLKFLAHCIAYEESTAKGTTQEEQLFTYKEGQNKTLSEIAALFQVDEEEVFAYNKWVKGKIPIDKTYSVIIPIKGKIPSKLRVPSQDLIASKVTLKAFPKEIIEGINEEKYKTKVKINNTIAYLSSAKDDVMSMAKKCNLTEKKFRKCNDLKAHQKIIEDFFYFAKGKKNRSKIPYHVTQENENLWYVSQIYGIKLKKLAKMNGLTSTEQIEVGRVLWLQKKRPKSVAIEYADVHQSTTQYEREFFDKKKWSNETKNKNALVHFVNKGESLWKIAEQYGIDISDLKNWNSLIENDVIEEGQKIIIKGYENVKKETEKYFEYVIEKGDSLYKISKEFGISIEKIKELNNLQSNQLEIGQMLKITK